MKNRLALFLALTLLVACGGSTDEVVDTSTTVAASTTSPVSSASWEEIAPPIIEGETDPVVTRGNTLVDGYYWASVQSVSGSGDLVFEVAQVRFGTACEEWAASLGGTVECTNDYGVQDVPSALVSMANDAEISVASMSGPGTNYSIDAPTLIGLVAGTVTSPIADFTWTPFPFVIVVDAGMVTTAHQFWVP